MNYSKILIATLVGGVVFFFGGYLIYGLALQGMMAEHTNSCVMRPMDQMNFSTLVGGNLAAAALMAFVFVGWANIQSFASGFTGGAVMGFFVGLSYDLTAMGTTTMMDSTGAVVDIIANTILWGITGGAVGLMLSMGKKP